MYQFKTLYWGSDNSTMAQFEIGDDMPATELITACMVAAIHENTLVMSRPERGWGLLGGHREEDETPEECVRREAMEEAAVELDDLVHIGGWRIKKMFESPENVAYPAEAYQPLFVSRVADVKEYVPQLEIFERAFVPFDKVEEYHHAFDDFSEVYNFLQTHPDFKRLL